MKISQTATLFIILCAAPQFGLATTHVDLADNMGLDESSSVLGIATNEVPLSPSLRGTVSNSVDPDSDGAHRKLEKMKKYTCDCEPETCVCFEKKNFKVGSDSITVTVKCKNKHQKVAFVSLNTEDDYTSHSCVNHMNDNGCNDIFDWRIHKPSGCKGNTIHVGGVFCELKSEDELKNSGYTKSSNGGSPEPGSLVRCEGDCDSDSECGDGLRCFQRPQGDKSDVPGCLGTPKKGQDYCIRENEVISTGFTKSSNGGSPEPGSLGRCEGDCDSDSECGDGLRCFQRPQGDKSDVPGCLGTPTKGWDYCIPE